MITLATESGTQGGAVVDVIGKGPNDGHGNAYDFSFVSDPDSSVTTSPEPASPVRTLS